MFAAIENKRQQQADLMAQLQRQLRFEQQFNVAPHDIKEITVRGSGYDTAISWVTMKDGVVHELKGFNAHLVLNGKEAWPNAANA